jgi:HAD superfamily hydrolase (TIGR01509 family)
MIELIIFDLDGVLISSRDWHYQTLNKSLAELGEKYVISYDEHLSRFDGLSTTMKLKILHMERGLPIEQFDRIWKRKQDFVSQIIEEQVVPNAKVCELLQKLKSSGYKLVCCSNSIMKTLLLVLTKMQILCFFEAIYSNDFPELLEHFPKCKPKPHPAMFMFACLKAGISPINALICEDSPIGRQAAQESGCWLCPIEIPEDLTLDKIQKYIQYSNQSQEQIPWIMTPKLNVLIPMAGEGSRFKKENYQDIKPLIIVKDNIPMIQLVVRNLNILARHIFIAQKQHIQEYCLKTWIPTITNSPTCLVGVNHKTNGAACTTLLAEFEINNDNPLLIANSDQFVECNMHAFLYKVMNEDIDGGILCFELDKPDTKWSYAEIDESSGFIKQVYEKRVVGKFATVGIYFWKKGSDYVKYAKQMMLDENNKVNNEFYVAPVYNFAIADQKKIIKFNVTKMWGIGTPNDLKYFQSNYFGKI